MNSIITPKSIRYIEWNESPLKRQRIDISTKSDTEKNRKKIDEPKKFTLTKNGEITQDSVINQTFNLEIKSYEIEKRVRPFSVRCQSAEKGSINQQFFNLCFNTPWAGLYFGSTNEQALGHANITVSENKIIKLFINRKIKVLELTGNFMSSSEITGNVKSAAIINLLKNTPLELKTGTIEAMKSITNHENEKKFPNELHLTRLLKNCGYDAIITEETEEDTEAIILNANKFYEQTAATIHAFRPIQGINTRFKIETENDKENRITNDIYDISLVETPTVLSSLFSKNTIPNTIASSESESIDGVTDSEASSEHSDNESDDDGINSQSDKLSETTDKEISSENSDNELDSEDLNECNNYFDSLVSNQTSPTRPISTLSSLSSSSSPSKSLIKRFEAMNM